MVKKTAPCKLKDSQQLRQRVRASQDISDLRLFPVRQSADADARVFFYDFLRFFQYIELHLLSTYLLIKSVNFFAQRVALFRKRRLFMFAHGLVSLIADDFIFPFVQYRATDANVPGDFSGRYMPYTKRHDSLTFHLRFKRCILIDRTGENKPSVGMTFINPASQYITAGITKSPAGKRQAAAMVKIMFNSSLLLHICIRRQLPRPHRDNYSGLFVI